MNMTFGGHKRMTISNQPYEPVQVESVLIIEKDASKMTDDEITELQDKVNRHLDRDLEKKVTETIKLQQKMRNKMKGLLKDLV